MSKNVFSASLGVVGVFFAVFFFVTMGPPFFENPDIIAAFGAGFVNEYSTGFSVDTICCWVILLLWVLYDYKNKGIKHGWLCVLIGAVPGVATGLALYMYLRAKQLGEL